MENKMEDGNGSLEKRDIRLIALDMDGTLLNEKGILSEHSRETLERAMRSGIHVVIATGRVWSALPKDVVGVPGIEYAITSNGAHIVRIGDKETIYSNLIERESVERIVDILAEQSIMTEVFFEHDVFAERRCLNNLGAFGITAEKSQHYTLSTRTPVDSTLELVQANMDRLENINLIFRDMGRRAEVWERLAAMEEITVTSSMPYNLEIGGATTSKGEAVRHLAAMLGIQQVQVMACGDSENDLSMLLAAGFSVAMENAVETVREKADFVTRSNREDGVAYVIERFAL